MTGYADYTYIMNKFIFTIAVFGAALSLSSVAHADCDGSPISQNETINSSLEPNDCVIDNILNNGDQSLVDVYTANFSSSASVTAKLESSEFDPFLQILDSNGTVMAQDDDSGQGFNAEISTTLGTGSYRFLVNSATSASQTGAYSFTLASQSTETTRLINIATRARIGKGDNVLIGGLVIGGSDKKKVVVRAIGPTLRNFGVPGTLADPVMQVFSGPNLIDSNDDWSEHPNVHSIPENLQPASHLEAAIYTELDPGAYTVILRGVNESEGVGLVEIYEVDSTENSRLLNIATRGRVGTGDNVMIAGLVITGNAEKSVLIRAAGPSLQDAGVPDTLANPVLSLFNSQGQQIDSNDDWQQHPDALNIPDQFKPKRDTEAAIRTSLQPGAYTAIVTGAGNSEGVAIVEVYELD